MSCIVTSVKSVYAKKAKLNAAKPLIVAPTDALRIKSGSHMEAIVKRPAPHSTFHV
jgi:hypothetical protein